MHRWGQFSDRRRYRCLTCGRTFSDFTGTPLAYLKRIEMWPAFVDCVLMSLPLRATAARLGVHLATAFRWRHLLLGGLRARPPRLLHGDIAIAEVWFPFSRKGQRDLDRAPRQPRAAYPQLARRVWVVLARDDGARTLAEVIGSHRPGAGDLGAILRTRVAAAATLCTPVGRLGAVGRFACSAGLDYRRLERFELPHHPVSVYARSLHVWLERFRGVATRYLPNYLAWHQVLDGVLTGGIESDAARKDLLFTATA